MKDNTFTLSVDIKKSNYLDEPTVTQNDEITFILQVTDDGEPFDLTEVSTFTLVSMRPDKQSIQTLGIKTGANEATFNLGTSELAVPGRVSAAIQLYDADGRVSSIPFSYQVLPDLAKGYIPSQNEQTLIELVLGQGPAILAAAQQATANIESLGFISEYDPLITYKKNNIVSYQGGSYIAKSDTTGNLPTNTIHWGKVAEKGEQGIQGIPGEQGIQGLPGEQGIQGIPGQNGTGSGTVTSVNGSQPDVAGNVELIIPNPDLTGLTTKTEFNEHKADDTSHVRYGTASGTNAKTTTLNPSPSALVEGFALSFKSTSANTGASTLNINGLGAKSILKSNGNAVSSGNLKAGSIYTVRFDGTSFILQGEGGEYGTAVAGDVLTGKTIGTENGIVSGTLSPGKKWASGTVSGGATPVSFTMGNGSSHSNYLASVTGLGFNPSVVILESTLYTASVTVLHVGNLHVGNTANSRITVSSGFDGRNLTSGVIIDYRLTGNAHNNNGFSLPVPVSTSVFKYTAYE